VSLIGETMTFKIEELADRAPDFEQFLKVLERRGRPTHLPFYEHFASPEFIARCTGVPFDTMAAEYEDFWKIYVNFWLDLGFDCVPMEIPLDCPLAPATRKESHGSEAHVVIRNIDDFERYPWPDESRPIDFGHFERAAACLPEGAAIVGGVCMGPFEWVSQMMGIEGLSYALVDAPDLVGAMFDKIGSLIVAAAAQLATMDAIGALRQGDDLGYKTATFLRPDDLRSLVFPTYRKLVNLAHAVDKPFILHSCGCLDEVYDDLADDVGIDAKHSFEEVILPVEEFKRSHGDRVTPLGGVDVDLICRGTEEEIRRETRRKIEACFHDGHYALGTGNSLTDYMPVDKYLIVLDEGLRAIG